VAAVLYGYFAVSGDQQESTVCSLCGFIAEADDWARFDLAWKVALADVRTGFQVSECFHGTGPFQCWDLPRRHALLANLAEALAGSSAVSMGALVVREHFLHLPPADHAILATQGIKTPLDLLFFDWMEQIIFRVHEQSEKISLLFCPESSATTERYHAIFSKHLGRYLLGRHLMGHLAFAEDCDSSQLQAAKLLSESVLLAEKQRLLVPEARAASPVIPPLLQLTRQLQKKSRFDAAELQKLVRSLRRSQVQ
jgi:hypothetical protein